ncbi:MAG: putative toxin-antitoxin system toxin component, PIN family [Deltaproteobacteria bacterium]|nr:putative toxin-antitoxin system toxin component, PIN family [Deltaproteobacteria bacterium]
MQNIVVDTGVLISAFAFDGIPEKVVKFVFTRHNLFVSPQILLEYRSVPVLLHRRKKINKPQLQSLIVGIASFVKPAIIVKAKKSIMLCRDPKDDIYLELCYAAKVDYLITGDKDLLAISEDQLNKLLPSLTIITPRNYFIKFIK